MYVVTIHNLDMSNNVNRSYGTIHMVPYILGLRSASGNGIVNDLVKGYNQASSAVVHINQCHSQKTKKAKMMAIITPT